MVKDIRDGVHFCEACQHSKTMSHNKLCHLQPPPPPSLIADLHIFMCIQLYHFHYQSTSAVCSQFLLVPHDGLRTH